MARKASRGSLWSDAELRLAVSAYVYLLYLQANKIERATFEIIGLLQKDLKNRNDASIRYRMRNISAVMRDYGFNVLKEYSPAPQVGNGVKSRIKKILDSYPRGALQYKIRSNDQIKNLSGRESALSRLGKLKADIESLYNELGITPSSRQGKIGIGHNNPPSSIDDDLPRQQVKEISDVLSLISHLEKELNKTSPDVREIKKGNNQLISVGYRISKWVGERLTKFVDATLATAAPLVALKLAGLLPSLAEAAQALVTFISSYQ